MAAVAHPSRWEGPELQWWSSSGDLHSRSYRSARRGGSRAQIYCRRRLAALTIAGLVLFVGSALGRLGVGALFAEPTSARASGARVAHVVRPGETLWIIARALEPTGDIRPLVGRLDAQQHGQPLQVGQTVVVP